MATSASTKIISGWLYDYFSTNRSGGLNIGSSTCCSGFSFDTFNKMKTEHVSGALPGNISSSPKVKIGKKTVIKMWKMT